MKRVHHIFLFSLLASALCAQSSSDPRNRRNKGTNLKPATVAVFASGDFYGMPYRLIEPLEIKDGVRYPLISEPARPRPVSGTIISARFGPGQPPSPIRSGAPRIPVSWSHLNPGHLGRRSMNALLK